MIFFALIVFFWDFKPQIWVFLGFSTTRGDGFRRLWPAATAESHRPYGRPEGKGWEKKKKEWNVFF